MNDPIGTKPMTHIVLKIKDMDCLNMQDRKALWEILDKIQAERASHGKNPSPTYLVVNTDEPYSDAVQGAIDNGEFQKEAVARRMRRKAVEMEDNA